MREVSARDLFKSAFDDLHGNKIEVAGDKFRTLLNADPDSADFLYGASCYYMKSNAKGVALNLLKQALSFKPNFVPALNNVGYILYNSQKIEDSREYFLKAIRINEKDCDAYINMAATYVAWGSPDEAIKYCKKALAIKPHEKQAKNNLSLSYLEKGDYAKGFNLYDARSIIENELEMAYSKNGTPEWDGKSEGVVCIYGEQGIGDEIMFGSLLKQVMKTNEVVLDCHPRLMNVWRYSYPGLKVFGTRKENIRAWPSIVKIDYKTSIASLCNLYLKSESDFVKEAYLKPNPNLFNYYKEKVKSNKLKIGISWSGGTPATNLSARKTNLEQWLPILKQDADFYSFQYVRSAEKDIEEFNKKYPDIKIHHWRKEIDDYEKTIALAANMDLIISVPQSIVHVGGAMSIPTWQLTPYRAMWQMGPRGKDLPWYENARSFWQSKPDDWKTVFKNAGEALCDLLQKNTGK